ncbi:MAG: hypothetical protein RSG77_14975 [Hafnia sp.]
MHLLDNIEQSILARALEVVRDHLYEEVSTEGKDFSYHFLANLLRKIDPCVQGKHHKWLLSLICKNADINPLVLYANVLEIHEVLFEFMVTKKYLPVHLRDIFRFTSVADLRAQLYAARLNSGKASKCLLASMSMESAMLDTKVQYEGQGMMIYKPRNIEQAILLGDGANWRFDDRDGGLYRSLRKDGVIMIWFTDAGRFLSVIPYHAGGAEYVIDEQGELVSFHDISSVQGEILDDDESLITAVISAESEAPFYLNWSVSSKIKAITANPLMLEKCEIREFIQDVVSQGQPSEVLWAKAVLESYINMVDSLSVLGDDL